MAQNQRITGADFSALGLGFTAPITADLAGWYWLGASAELSGKNQASLLGDPAVPIGAIIYNQGYAAFGNGGYLLTPLADSAEVTFVAVARRPTIVAGYNGSIMGAYSTGPLGGAYGTWMTISTATNCQFNAPRNNAGASVNVSTTATTTNTANWGLYIGEGGDASASEVYPMSGGTPASTASALPRAVNTLATWKIGSFGLGGSPGAVDIACAAFFRRKLSAAERTTLNDYFRSAMPVRNPAIVLP